MRPMTDSEICGIIFNGIIDGTDIEVINGPAETIIRINIDAIHNNEEYWEELNKFNPDKWMVKGFEPKKNSFIIFGGGLRVCPGRKLSKIELILN
ncbi:cytochrome P450 [Rhizophagus irregularis DAOM 181602=DAOM 197198]|nr:cytochrome P450 [Rhizophagus irregularis DAOM 181602=DAOM 197198]